MKLCKQPAPTIKIYVKCVTITKPTPDTGIALYLHGETLRKETGGRVLADNTVVVQLSANDLSKSHESLVCLTVVLDQDGVLKRKKKVAFTFSDVLNQFSDGFVAFCRVKSNGLICVLSLRLPVGLDLQCPNCGSPMIHPEDKDSSFHRLVGLKEYLPRKFKKSLFCHLCGSSQDVLVCTKKRTPTCKFCAVVNSSRSTHFQGEPSVKFEGAGGTAAFYKIGDPKYIAKDLTHAKDEVVFYETASLIRGLIDQYFDPTNQEIQKAWSILDYVPEYFGIANSVKDGEGDSQPTSSGGEPKRHLKYFLVLENFFYQCPQLRMVDIKVGAKTGEYGWMGKGHRGAAKSVFLDRHTATRASGLRVEGFVNPPECLKSMLASHSKKSQKFRLQRLSFPDVFLHFLNFRSNGDKELGFAQLLFAQQALILILEELRQVILGAQAMKVEQKWVGSSLMMAVNPDINGPPQIQVKLFDFGKSRLSVINGQEPGDNNTFYWESYKKGLASLLYEGLDFYHHNFMATHFSQCTIKLFYYNWQLSLEETFVGQCVLELDPDTPMKRAIQYFDKKSGASLVYSLNYTPKPNAGVWALRVHELVGLPRLEGAFLRIIFQNDLHSAQCSSSLLTQDRNYLSETFSFLVQYHPKVLTTWEPLMSVDALVKSLNTPLFAP